MKHPLEARAIRAEGIGTVFDGGRLTGPAVPDRDHVEPAWAIVKPAHRQEDPRRTDDPPSLERADGLEWVAQYRSAPAADLHENDSLSIHHDQVDLSVAQPKAALDEAVPPVGQIGLGEGLAASPKADPGVSFSSSRHDSSPSPSPRITVPLDCAA